MCLALGFGEPSNLPVWRLTDRVGVGVSHKAAKTLFRDFEVPGAVRPLNEVLTRMRHKKK